MSNLKSMMESRMAGLNAMLEAKNERFRLEQTSVFKNNGLVEGYVLRDPDRAVAPTVYLDEDQMNMTDAEIVQYLVDVFSRCDRPDLVSVREMFDRDRILESVLPRLYDSTNAALMSERGVAYMQLAELGLLVGFYLVVSSCGSGTATVTLTSSHLSSVGLSVDELYDAAVQNLEPLVTVENISVLLAQMTGLSASDLGMASDLPMWVVSDANRLQGAAAILCPSVLSQLEDLLGSRFYILPSSISEVIAVPYSTSDTDSLVSMVTEINATVVSAQDVLCDRVFLFDGERLVAA